MEPRLWDAAAQTRQSIRFPGVGGGPERDTKLGMGAQHGTTELKVHQVTPHCLLSGAPRAAWLLSTTTHSR